jgi:hypothetical protein
MSIMFVTMSKLYVKDVAILLFNKPLFTNKYILKKLFLQNMSELEETSISALDLIS